MGVLLLSCSKCTQSAAGAGGSRAEAVVGPGGQEPGGWGCGVGQQVGAEVRSMEL